MLGGATIKDTGVWLPQNGGAQTMVPAQMTLPYQDWARGVAADREKNQLEPHTRCKPSGAARQFLTPYGVEFVDLPEAKRVSSSTSADRTRIAPSTWIAARTRPR